MFKKSTLCILTAILVILSILTACSPAATALDPTPTSEVPTEGNVDSVTCFNSETVVVTKDGIRFGIVPEHPPPVNNSDFYAPLKKDGDFKAVAFAPEGSTFDYISENNTYISVRNYFNTMVIIVGNYVETCDPMTTWVESWGHYGGFSVSDAPQEIRACGDDAQTGERILLVFIGDGTRNVYKDIKDMISLYKAEGGFIIESHGESYNKKFQENINITALSWRDYIDFESEISICSAGENIGVEQGEWRPEPGYEIWKYAGSWDPNIIFSAEMGTYVEVIDSNVCRKTDIVGINVVMQSSIDLDLYYMLDKAVGTLDVYLGNLYLKRTEYGAYGIEHEVIDNELYLVKNVPLGKGVLIKYTDQEGNLKELPLIENCGTYLSTIIR